MHRYCTFRYETRSSLTWPVGLNCGLLDPISSLFGKANALGMLSVACIVCFRLVAMFLTVSHSSLPVQSDFRTLEVQTVPLDPSLCFLICNTHASHTLVGSEYNERRESCEKCGISHIHTYTHTHSLSLSLFSLSPHLCYQSRKVICRDPYPQESYSSARRDVQFIVIPSLSRTCACLFACPGPTASSWP
jgi:hypothetical protein